MNLINVHVTCISILRTYSNECVQYVTVLKPKTRNYTEKDDIMALH